MADHQANVPFWLSSLSCFSFPTIHLVLVVLFCTCKYLPWNKPWNATIEMCSGTAALPWYTLFTRAHVNSGFTHKAKFEGSVHGVVVHASTYEFSWALREDSRSMCSSAAGSVFTYKKQRNIVYYCVLHASTRSYISAFVFSCHFLFLRHWCVAFCSTHYCPRPWAFDGWQMKLCTWDEATTSSLLMFFHLLRTTLELNNDGGIGDLFVVLRHLCKQKALRRKLCPGVDHDANLIGKNEQKEQWQLQASKLDNGVVQAVL